MHRRRDKGFCQDCIAFPEARGVSLLSFPSLDDRSGFDFLDSEVLPLLEVKLEDEFKSFCLDLEEPLPF